MSFSLEYQPYLHFHHLHPSFLQKKKETADKTDIVMLGGGGYNHFHILSLVIWSNMQPVEQAPSACNAMCDHACGMRVNSTLFLQVFQYALVK